MHFFKMNIIVLFGVILLVGNRYVFEICKGPLEIVSCSPTLVNVGPWHPKAMVVCASLHPQLRHRGNWNFPARDLIFHTQMVSSVM
jgi:hypothetical protein